jgi:hemerythrin-like domain-containing protein
VNTTTILLNEHRIIEQVLNCLERMVERCELHRTLQSGTARDAMVFFRGFVERCHYSRVDARLLPAMRAEGIPPERCLGCSLRQRRDECGFHLDAMEAAIEPASTGHATARKQFTEHAQKYIELMLELIADQEDCAFPMIARAVRKADKAPRTTANHEDEAEYVCNTYVDVANRLADHFGVPRAVIADSAGNRSVNKSA